MLDAAGNGCSLRTGGAVVDLAVPDAALTDDVPRLSGGAARDDRLVAGTSHVCAARHHRIHAPNHCDDTHRL